MLTRRDEIELRIGFLEQELITHTNSTNLTIMVLRRALQELEQVEALEEENIQRLESGCAQHAKIMQLEAKVTELEHHKKNCHDVITHLESVLINAGIPDEYKPTQAFYDPTNVRGTSNLNDPKLGATHLFNILKPE